MKQFRLLGRAALIFSIALALMVVPTTITMASAYRALSNDYASWESLKDAVGISYNDVIIGCTVFDVCTVEFCWVYFLFEARVFANVIQAGMTVLR